MKMIERIRHVRATPEAGEFVRLWQRFQETGSLPAGLATRMVTRGNELIRWVDDQVKVHLHAQVPSGRTNEHRGNLLVLEAHRSRDRSLQKVFPELLDYTAFVERAIRGRPEKAPT